MKPLLTLHLFALVVLACTVDAPAPPYVRSSTVTAFPGAYRPPVAVHGAAFYTAEDRTCAAFHFPTLNRKWTLRLPEPGHARALAAADDLVYVAFDPPHASTRSRLYAIDARTGRVRWSLPRTGRASPIAAGRGVLYLSLAPNSISAIDAKTRGRRWTRSLTAGVRSPFGERTEAITLAGDSLLVSNRNVTYCLHASNGKERWRQTRSLLRGSDTLVAQGVALVPAGESTVGRELRSGAVLWRVSAGALGDVSCATDRSFIGIGEGKLRAIDARSGKVLWSRVLGPRDTSGGDQYVAMIGSRIYARGIARAGVFDRDGREQTSGPAELFLPEPIWSDGATLVCFDGSRLLAYRSGQAARLPADAAARRRLAADLVGRFEALDREERSRLAALGQDAFEPVLSAMRAASEAYDAATARARDRDALYTRFNDLTELLAKVATHRSVGALLDALQKEKKESSARPWLLDLAGKVGDPAVLTPVFLAELGRDGGVAVRRREHSAQVVLHYLLRFSDPRAVASLTRVVRDRGSEPWLRAAVYVRLAGSGDPDAVRAVLAERARRSLLRPIEERVIGGIRQAREADERTRVLAQRRDADGRTWGLLQSGALGRAGDLWLAERQRQAWKRPLFSGVSKLGISPWVRPAPPEPRIGGQTGKQLAAGAWFGVLLKNAAIRRDSDGDGLTDLAEKRLGTNAAGKDTDGDGDPDGVDPWPNASKRPRSDEEQVYEAVFEARFHFETGEGPVLVFAPDKMRPFEMVGRRGPSLWASSDRPRWTHPLELCYEQGVTHVSFHRDEDPARSSEVIRWNKDRTEATLIIAVYRGGTYGSGHTARVRRFGNDWVVVSLDVAYVS